MQKFFKKGILLFLLFIALFAPLVIRAAESGTAANDEAIERAFKAEVIEVVKEVKSVDDQGRETVKQALKLRGREGEWKNKEFTYDGTTLDLEIAGQAVYEKGDRVYVIHNVTSAGEERFFIMDFVRTNRLYILLFLFVAVVLFIGKKQGLKALIGLAATFIILMKFIVPQILAGSNPLLISIVGSAIILTITLYLVHGLNSKTSVAIIGTVLSLLITGILSIIFTNLTRLTGFAEEEAAFLLNIGNQVLNVKGVLLAGMIIGALGVLDDITVSQASIAEQIYKVNPNLSRKEIYTRAMKVGIDHVSSIVNTLVLAYAGASLSVMLLLGVGGTSALPIAQALNNETIATEIVRTMVGSIGLVLAVPLTTFIAAYAFKRGYAKAGSYEGGHVH